MASAATESPVLTGKNIPGYCIVLDLVTTERNKRSWSMLKEEIDQVCELFSGFGYHVKLIKDKRETEMKTELRDIKDRINDEHASLVFIVFDNQWAKIRIGDDVKWSPSSNAPEFYIEFDEVRCKPLRNKPKILLRHSIRQMTDDAITTCAMPERLYNTFSAASIMEGTRSQIQQQKSCFIQTLVDVCSTCDEETNIIDLFSKVCERVEAECRKLPNKGDGVGRVIQKFTYHKNIKSTKDPVINPFLKTLVKNLQAPSQIAEQMGEKKVINVKETKPTSTKPLIMAKTETEKTKPTSTESSSMAQTDTETPDVANKEFQGACVILDLVTYESGWDILKSQIEEMRSMFEGMSYKVLDIPANTEMDIKNNLMEVVCEWAEILPRNAPIVFFLCGKLYKSYTKHSTDIRKEILTKFKSYCDKLYTEEETKTIIIQHVMDKVLTEDDATGGEIPNKFPGVIIDVNSTILGTEEQAKKTKSLFLESLVDTLKRFSSYYDVVQLFNKITYDVELTQYQQPTYKESDTGFQEVTFNIFKLSNYKLTTVHSLTSVEIPVLPEPSLTNTTELQTKLQFQVMKESQDPHQYKMSNKPRGYCIIINSSNDRIGSRIDEMKMKNLFEELFFEVNIIRNQSHQKIKEKLKCLAEFMPNEHQALIVFLMAYGGQGGKDKKSHVFQDVEGGVEESAYIYETFDGKHCKALINRPKIYIVPTSFGGDGTSSTVGDTREAAHKKSDMLIFNAASSGHTSYRTVQGTYLIRAIDEIFRQQSAEKDIQQLLTMVCGKIAMDPKTGKTKWQQPVFKAFALNEKLFLNPGFYKDNLTDCYRPEAELRNDDKVHIYWFDTSGECVIGVNKHNSSVMEWKLDTNIITAYNCTDSAYRERVVNGVALDEDKHLVLLNVDGKLTLSVIHTSSAGGHNTWKMEGPLVSAKVHPIAICEVYRDAVGVLTNRLELEIYCRKEFLDNWSKLTFHSVKLAGHTITKASVNVLAEKVLVLDHDSKTVLEYDFDGNKLHTLSHGSFNKPCGLTTDKDTNAVVVCADGLHSYANNSWSHITRNKFNFKSEGMCCNAAYTVCVYDSGHLNECYNPEAAVTNILGSKAWFTKGKTSVIVTDANGPDIREVKLPDASSVSEYQCTDTRVKGTIVKGVALTDNKHLIHAIIDGQHEVVILHTSSREGSSTWRMDDPLLLCSQPPVAICAVGETSVGILSAKQECLELQIHKAELFPCTRADTVYIDLPHQTITDASLRIVDEKVFVFNHDDKSVTEYNIKGVQTNKLPKGAFTKPCGLSSDIDGNLIAVGDDGLQMLNDGMWSALYIGKRTRIRQMCCDFSNTIFVTECIRTAGLCVIDDLCDSRNNRTVLKNLFSDLNYDTTTTKYKEARITSPIQVIQDSLKDNVISNHKSVIVVVILAGDSDMESKINGYQQVFDGCEQLKDKPKILINHVYSKCSLTLNKPPETVLHICSQIEGDDTDEDSLFIKSLDKIMRKYHNQYDIYELLTKVLRDVEIPQHIAKRDGEWVAGKTTYHRVKFTTSLKTPLRFADTPCESSSINNDFSITQQGEELNNEAAESLFCFTDSPKEVHDNDCYVFKHQTEKTFKLKSITIDTKHCSEIIFELKFDNRSSIMSKVRIEQVKAWSKESIGEDEFPRRSINRLDIKFKTSFGKAQIRDIRMKVSLEGDKDIFLGRSLKLHDDEFPSTSDSFYLSPGQYAELGRISKNDLPEKFSVDVQCKVNDPFYRMDRQPRGFCVIINISNDRPGSLIDEAKMKQLFEELYFEVRIVNNRTHEEIEKEMGNLKSQITDQHQCLVVLIMGHGESRNKIHRFYDVEGKPCSSDDILDVFKTSVNLNGKPKIFIIQTCFVVPKDPYTKESDAPSAVTPADPVTIAGREQRDTIQLNATLEELKSYRIPLEGAFLVQAVDEMLRKHSADMEITQLMTEIKNEVSKKTNMKHPFQQPETKDILNSHLFFMPGFSMSILPNVPAIQDDNTLSIRGSIVWQNTTQDVFVADRNDTWIQKRNVNEKEDKKYSSSNDGGMSGVLCGVSVNRQGNDDHNEHILVVRMDNGSRKALYIELENNNWKALCTLLKSVEPLMLCCVNNDGVAICCGDYGYCDATIDIYSCNVIYRDLQDTKLWKSIKIRNNIVKSPEIEPLCLGTGDAMCYSYTKFYISCFITSTVYQVSIDGEIEQAFGNPASKPLLNQLGHLYKPCGVFTRREGNSEQLIVACNDVIHQGTITPGEDTNKWNMEWTNFYPYASDDPFASGDVQGFWYNEKMRIKIPQEKPPGNCVCQNTRL